MGHLRKSTVSDLDHVVKNLRILDKIEAWYQTGEAPEEALRRTYLSSKQVRTIAGDDDQPMGLCGVVVNGVIWMVATDELFSKRKYKIQLIRQCFSRSIRCKSSSSPLGKVRIRCCNCCSST